MEPSKMRMKTMATKALHLTPIMIHYPPPCCVSSGAWLPSQSMRSQSLSWASLNHCAQYLASLTQCDCQFFNGFQSSLNHKLVSKFLPSCVHTTRETQSVCNFLFCATPLFLYTKVSPPVELMLSWFLHYAVFLSFVSCPALSVLSVSSDVAQSQSP